SDEETSDKAIYTLIDEAIESLPPRQKEVFLLHRYERFTYLQIAEKLGIGRESVKTHLGHAVRAISKYLGQKAGLFILLAVEIKTNF
ncbi:MAG TPA: sigma-70 family RNA polymerase sigma factor, partial [Flavitalea sp.]|nr:sigma-70 family RNA polymerase sigma factor [Flavitalea sp.]